MKKLASFLIVIGVTIMIHECGHFLAARAYGVEVKEFSIGFGPELIGFQSGATRYKISAVPLGGYVEMNPRSFASKPPSAIFVILAAGVTFNLILAYFLFVLYNLVGFKSGFVRMTSVKEGSKAEEAGLKPGDVVKSIKGENLKQEGMVIISEDPELRPVTFNIERDEKPLSIDVIPEKVEDRQGFGFELAVESTLKRYGLLKAMILSLVRLFGVIALTFGAFKDFFTGKRKAKEIFGGPVSLFIDAGDAAKQGLNDLVLYTAIISVLLAIMNFLPIPLTDGGQSILLAVALLRDEPLSPGFIEAWQWAGYIIIGGLMLLALGFDIARVARMRKRKFINEFQDLLSDLPDDARAHAVIAAVERKWELDQKVIDSASGYLQEAKEFALLARLMESAGNIKEAIRFRIRNMDIHEADSLAEEHDLVNELIDLYAEEGLYSYAVAWAENTGNTEKEAELRELAEK
jgi:regulator of sigma E protease